MITFDGVSKVIGFWPKQRVVLREANAHFPAANIAVLGPSAFDKSLLLRLVAGTSVPTRGDIVRDVSVSWPFGSHRVLSGLMSGAENVRFLARVYGHDVDEKVETVRLYADIGRQFDEPVDEYSPDDRIRLAYSTSVAFEFDVYIVEELNRMRTMALRGKLANAMEQRLDSARLIVTSQRTADLMSYCQAAVVIENGTLTMHSDMRSAIATSRARANV